MHNFLRRGYLVAVLLIGELLFFSIESSAQISDKEIVSRSDTSQFNPNSKAGWGIMLGFVQATGSDSVRLELVLYNEEQVSLKERQLVGKIKGKKLLPGSTRVCQVGMGQHQFELSVEKNGSVLLLLVAGPDLEAGKKILPITAFYKL